ncbi:MAG: mycofactocin biosynthesis peptidyl-dipeptidase MftE, partial [Solirubrobacteraceae bacterium]
QHGPHLPLSTDTVIAAAVAEAAAHDRPDVAVAPALPYGASGEHAAFPGTLSLGLEAMETALVELVRSADHFADVILVSWHGGNAEAVARAVARSRGDGRAVSRWEPRLGGAGTGVHADVHAGRIETSLMLAIAPELVGEERPAGPSEPLAALMPALRTRGVQEVSASGVLGDARGASAAEGHALLASLTADLAAFLAQTQPVALRS